MTTPFPTDPAPASLHSEPENALFLTDKAEIKDWLAKHFIISGAVTISPAGVVSVKGDVKLNAVAKQQLTNFAVQFEHVSGNFWCDECRTLQSLQGGPRFVGGNFQCGRCSDLKSLVGAPATVGGDFYCYNCSSLTSLEGSPQTVGGDFNCEECNNLDTLQGSPTTVDGYFSCDNCKKLKNLIGSPPVVGLDFYCNYCDNLETFEGAPQSVGLTFSCRNCHSILNIENLPSIGYSFCFTKVPKPPAPVAIKLIQNRTKIETYQKAEWIYMLRRYQTSGDIIAAITRFEACYKVSFNAIVGATTPEPEEPSL